MGAASKGAWIDHTSTGGEEVPGHLQKLYAAAKESCRGEQEPQRLANLLNDYSTVFSTGYDGVGRTALVEPSIPVMEETRPVRLPPHQLELEKEA